jgi:hypothetical protein
MPEDKGSHVLTISIAKEQIANFYFRYKQFRPPRERLFAWSSSRVKLRNQPDFGPSLLLTSISPGISLLLVAEFPRQDRHTSKILDDRPRDLHPFLDPSCRSYYPHISCTLATMVATAAQPPVNGDAQPSSQVDLSTIPISPDGSNSNENKKPSGEKEDEGQITVFHDKDNFNVKHPLMHKWTLWFTKPSSGKVYLVGNRS